MRLRAFVAALIAGRVGDADVSPAVCRHRSHMEGFMLRNYHWNLLGIFALVAVITVVAVAAPGPEPRNVDMIEGTFTLKSNSDPVIVVSVRTPEGGWVLVDYWLVFVTKEAEQQAAKIESEMAVKAAGRLGHGGQYRYLIVSKIEKGK